MRHRLGTWPQAWDPEWELSKKVIGKDGGGEISGGGRRVKSTLFSEKSHFYLGRVGNNPERGRIGCGRECGF